MTQEEIVERNKRIAEFMGYTYFPHNHPELGEFPPGWKTSLDTYNMSKLNYFGRRYLCRSHNQLAYHRNWNWIMPIVAKINNMEFAPGNHYEFVITPNRVWITGSPRHNIICSATVNNQEQLLHHIWGTISQFVEQQDIITWQIANQ